MRPWSELTTVAEASSAFFTLLAITTGGINWSKDYVLVFDREAGVASVDPVRGLFFLTFDLSVNVTTFNIMLAVSKMVNSPCYSGGT